MTPETKARCSVCGVISSHVSAFIHHRANFDRTRRYCSLCWKKKTSGEGHGFMAVWLTYAVFTITLLFLMPHRTITMTMVNFCWFQVCLVLATLPHELGHAFAARWVEHRVFRVIIGTGKTQWRGEIFGFDTEIQFPFIGGWILTFPTMVKDFRRRKSLILLAGPLANALLLLLALAMLYPQRLSWSAIVSRHFEGWQMLAFANAFVVILNLLPHVVNTSLGPLSTDGKQFLELLFRPAGQDTAAHAAWFYLEARDCQERGYPEEARRWLERGLALYPQHYSLRTAHAESLVDAHQFSEGREALLAMIQDFKLQPADRARLQSLIAFADILLDQDALLDEADTYSAEALAMFPWDSKVQTIRGAVLISQGRFKESLPMLRAAAQATRDEERPHAEAVCFLAIAEAGVGNRAAAEKLRERARSVEPRCYLLPRVEAALHALTIIEFQKLNASGAPPD